MTTRLQSTRVKQLLQFVLILGVGLLPGWLSNTAQAKPPTSVGLISFSATVQENGIRLNWETASELNTDGFYLKRSLNSDGPFITLSEIGFIGSQGDVATGATYSRVDETAVYNTTYTYQLVEVESGPVENPLETVTITFIIVPTATPIVLGGDDPTSPSTQTPAPTSTPSPTGTVQNTAVPPTATSNTTTSQTSATATPSPTATFSGRTESSQPQPTNTPALVIDTTFTEESGDTRVVLAQEEDDTAYPGPAPTLAPDSDAAAYPGGQPPTAVPGNPTSYPAQTAVPPTIAVIGNDEVPFPEPESYPPPANQDEIIRGRIFLWIGFTVAMLIFISGAVGSIVLYRRKRE